MMNQLARELVGFEVEVESESETSAVSPMGVGGVVYSGR